MDDFLEHFWVRFPGWSPSGRAPRALRFLSLFLGSTSEAIFFVLGEILGSFGRSTWKPKSISGMFFSNAILVSIFHGF